MLLTTNERALVDRIVKIKAVRPANDNEARERSLRLRALVASLSGSYYRNPICDGQRGLVEL